jgi:adenylate kinase family enzyme
MKKVVIIGSGGAGKSTFSRKLGEVTGLPVIHLDKLYWRPNWKQTPRDEWIPIVAREIAKPEWIIDGNFGNTRVMRMQAADTIIMLDLPRLVCMYRILKRAFIYHEGNRPDMAEGCHEKFDPEFVLWVWNYKNSSRVRAMEEIANLKDTRVVILRSRREVAEFLKRPYAN